jgi:hypothetical protein
MKSLRIPLFIIGLAALPLAMSHADPLSIGADLGAKLTLEPKAELTNQSTLDTNYPALETSLKTPVTLPGTQDMGPNDGGGGKGVMCGNTLRVLDLYESEVLKGQKPGPDFSSMKKAMQHYGVIWEQHLYRRKIDPNDSLWKNHAFNDLNSTLNAFMFQNSAVPISHDATVPKIPDECFIVQIAYVDQKTGLVSVDKTLWNILPVRDRTALIMHESEYSMVLMYNGVQASSDRVRSLVGKLFSTAKKSPLLESMWNKNRYLHCDPPATFEFTMVNEKRNGKKGILFMFSVMNGDIAVNATTGFRPRLQVDQLKKKNFALNTIVADEKTGESWNVEMVVEDIGGNPSEPYISAQARVWKTGTKKPAYEPTMCQYGFNQDE